MTQVYYDDKWMDKDEMLALRAKREVKRARSDELQAPLVMRDIEPYQCMLTGRTITSRAEHNELLRANGLVEIGNDAPDLDKPRQVLKKGEIRNEIKETIEQLEQGYVNPDDGILPKEGDYSRVAEEDAVDLDEFDLDAPIKNGDLLRANVTPDE